ncbi:hypothetical protein ABPG74_020576 [Tetrahymena malaccensis]
MKSNNINNEGTIAIMSSIENLYSLTEFSLDLENNQIDQVGIKAITSGLYKLKNLNLIKLNLNNNKVLDECLQDLRDSLIELKMLSNLNLNLNCKHRSDTGLLFLGQALEKISNLTHLSLDIHQKVNQKLEEGLIKLVQSIQFLSNLKQIAINFQDISISEQVAQNLSTSFSNMDNLTDIALGLQNCEISDKAAELIQIGLNCLSSLRKFYFNVSKNQIGNSQLQQFQFMKSLQSLEKCSLKLCSSLISNVGALSLANVLENCIQLQILDLNLSKSKIDNEGISLICQALIKLQSINQLSLDFDFIDVEDSSLKYLSISIEKMKKFQSQCDPTKNNCCDQSCLSCSQSQISQCTSCSLNYFYMNKQYQCLKTCPQGSFLNSINNQCIPCTSQYCSQCSSSECLQCNQGFQKDRNDPLNCVSQCSQIGLIQDDQKDCNYGCLNDQIYDIDYQSFSCQVKVQCPQIQQIPSLQVLNVIVSSLLDKSMTTLTLVDVSGYIVQYSYPKLQAQMAFQLNISSYQVLDCTYQNNSDLINNVMTCLLQPLNLIRFYNSNGRIIMQSFFTYNNTKNTGNLIQSFQKGSDQNLILSQIAKYEINILFYSNSTYLTIDTSSTSQISLFQVKQYTYQNSFQMLSLNLTNQSVTFYQISPYQKVLAYNSSSIDSTAKLIQLDSLYYWILYTSTQINLMYFNYDSISMNLLQTTQIASLIYSVFLIPQTDMIVIVSGTAVQNNLKLNLYSFNQQNSQIQPFKISIQNQISNITQIYSFGNLLIICTKNNVGSYQFSSDYSDLQIIQTLQQVNPQLCPLSTFSVNNVNSEIHFWQTVQKNFILNTFNTINQQNDVFFIAQNAITSQVLSKITAKSTNFNLPVELPEIQMILEVKSYGLAFIYDIVAKKIVNQIRIWYTINELSTQLLFHYQILPDGTYLFTGFEMYTFKIKIINIKTLEIIYQQAFPEINVDLNKINFVNQPLYYPNSDSFIACIQYYKQLTDTQKNFLFLFFTKNTDQSSMNKYKFYQSLQIFGTNYMQSVSIEYLMIFYMISTQRYTTYFYNLKGTKVLNSPQYQQLDQNLLGKVNEQAKQAFIFSYTGIIIYNLVSLSYIIQPFQCAANIYFSSNFQYYYTQSVCQSYQDGAFTYPNNTLISQGVVPKNKFVYIYKSYYNDSYVIIATSSANQLYYDNFRQQIFQKPTQYGTNQGGMIEENEVIFFNTQAITHYDLKTFNLIYIELLDYAFSRTFLLQTQFLRYNYLIPTLFNLAQVKKVKQITIQVTKSLYPQQSYYIDFIIELNYVVEVLPQSINIYNSLNNQIIYSVFPKETIETLIQDNFKTQELFTRQILYYQPSNLIVVVYYLSLICIDASTFSVLFQYKYLEQNQAFKAIVIDWNRGYLISTNLDQDCIFDMNVKELKEPAYKDNPEYLGLPNKNFYDYLQYLFINYQTNQLIICQMISVRVFALDTLQYVKSIYDTNLYAAQYFFNPTYNYLIYVQYYNYIFKLLDLSTMQQTTLSLPLPSGDYQSINYRFFFLDDKQTYIFLNSNYLFIYLYDQKTHQLINKIALNAAFFPYSDVVVDQVNQLIFLFDVNNCINQFSYSTNNLLSQYQVKIFSIFFLNQTDALAFQKYLIWDSYKQRIILSSNSTVYLINVKRSSIELYQVDTFVTQLRLFYNKNIIQYSTYYQNVLLDYDYLLNNNQATFPTQVNPRFFKVNNYTYFQLNDINTQANLFVNQTITSAWIRNNQNSGYIRILENDLQNLLIYAVFDNEIVILDLSTSLLIQTNQLFLTQNIIKVLFENQDHIILLSQSQQLLQLQKRQKSIKINELIVLKQGIAQYIFANNLQKLLFTDYSGSQQNLNFVNLSFDSNNNIKGQLQTQIIMPSRILSIQQLNSSQIVILMSNLIKIYDYTQLSEIASKGLEFNIIFGNILIDNTYQRIFLQNQMVGSLVYDFNLQKKADSFINSFSTNLYFDDKFIYSVVSHSANIYFRQDLKLLFNFRHFNSTLELKKIKYLGVGYFFLVEFISKLSVFEFSPFVSLPTEKVFVQINQYSIIGFSFEKLLVDNYSSYEYLLNIKGFTLEGMFTYSLVLDIYSQQQTQSCSLNYELQQYKYQDDTSFNQVSSYLTSQQRKLKGVTVNVSKFQNLHFPQLQQSVLNSIFQLIIAPKEQNTIVYIQDPLNQQQGISFIQIKNLEIQSSPSNYKSYLQNNNIPTNLTINKIVFPDIQQILLENITITEANVRINNLRTVIIQKINMQHFENQTLSTITQLNITNVSLAIITEINLISCKFNLGNPLIILQNIEQLQIKNLTVSNCACSGLDQILFINQVQNLTLENIFISQTNFTQQSSFTISSVQSVDILSLKLLDIQYNNSQSQLRQLQTQRINSVSQKLFYFSNNVNVGFGNIKIVNFSINTTNEFTIFDFELVQTDLRVNSSQFENINIDNSQIGTVFTYLGVYSTYLNSTILQRVNNMRCLLLQSYQISDAHNFESKNLIITNLTASNAQINQQSFFQIVSSSVLLDDIKFENITFQYTGASQQISFMNFIADEILLIQNSSFSQIISSVGSTIQIQNSKNVNVSYTSFYQLTTNGASSALKIVDSQNINLKSNTVSQCISSQDSGAIQINSCQVVTIQNNNFQNCSTIAGNGGVLYVSNSQINNFDFNYFSSNSAALGSGGALYCENSNFNTFNSNQFIKNMASLGSGGAILLNNCDIQKIQNNTFNYNQAFIGGGIRYINFQPFAIMKNGVNNLKKDNTFYKNKAISYGVNVGSYPKILNMKNYNNYTNEQNFLDNVQSGYKLSQPILMRFIDEEMREVSFVDLYLYPNISQSVLEEMSVYILQAESNSIGLLGDLRQAYSLTHFAFVFDLSYSYQPSSSAILNIKSAQLLPQFQQNTQQVIQQRYNIPITINFRKCQLGEVLQQSGNYTLCYQCGLGFYSIVDPYSDKNINCKRCPIGSVSCQSSQIIIQNGYWRKDNLSDIIIQCQISQFCQPEDPESKNGCFKGHVGPICQECDVSGQIWGTQYSKSNQECNDCQHFISVWNIMFMLLVLGFIFIQIYTKIQNEIVLIRKYIMAKYLSKLRFVSPNVQRTQTSQASLTKILINYFQFLVIVNSLNIALPAYFTFFNLTGGDTSQITIYQIDCLLFSKELTIPSYIIRLLWINIQPITLFVLIQFFRLIFKINDSFSQKQSFYPNLINIYLFFQPSIVKVISQSLSCQEIGLQSYISSDLNYLCLDSQHIKYIQICVIPLALIWIVFIPLFLFLRMRKYKQQQESIKILFKYGYLYQEYVNDKYYWDLARLIIRSIGIIVINIFNFQLLFKGMILFGVMYFYLTLQKKLKPFILQKFNNLEQESSFLVIITIYMLFIGNLSNNEIISYIVTIVIGIVNFKFVLKMISLILIKPTPAEQIKRNLFQKILFMLKQKFPNQFKWVKIEHCYSRRLFQNWKKVLIVMQNIKAELQQEYINPQQKINTANQILKNSLLMSQRLKNQSRFQKQNSNDLLFISDSKRGEKSQFQQYKKYDFKLQLK